MQVVLSQWILKFHLLPVDDLRPLGLIFSSENPTAHVLRFDHENAERADVNVVYLGGPIADPHRDI